MTLRPEPDTSQADWFVDATSDWQQTATFGPAGFDAYAHDPVATLSLEMSDFGELGKWVREAALPTAAVLEGGYSPDLPQLMDAFLSAWEG